MAAKKRRKKKNKLKLRTSVKIFLILILLIIFYFIFFTDKKIDISKFKFINPIKLHRKQQKIYKECLKNPLPEENFNENTLNKKNEIISYASKNGLRYTFEDLTFGYQINYNENEPLYGASLIKLVTAIYLIENDVDLSQQIKYTSNFVSKYSEGMEKRKIGENITLQDLMKYSITVSDNTAHHMLVNYIGKSKLKEYAKSLGATAIFTGSSDDYGNQITHDTNIYLKKAYELINTKENGKLLKEYMSNDRKNKLNTENISIAHKYGSYDMYYHDIGINFDKHPYTISVLTTKGESGAGKYINAISVLTKEFSDLYYENQETYCKELSQKKD